MPSSASTRPPRGVLLKRSHVLLPACGKSHSERHSTLKNSKNWTNDLEPHRRMPGPDPGPEPRPKLLFRRKPSSKTSGKPQV